MPIYPFQCQKCKHAFEDIFKFNDPPPVCPHCDGGPMKRLIGDTNFRLRGGGWTGSNYSRYRHKTEGV